MRQKNHALKKANVFLQVASLFFFCTTITLEQRPFSENLKKQALYQNSMKIWERFSFSSNFFCLPPGLNCENCWKTLFEQKFSLRKHVLTQFNLQERHFLQLMCFSTDYVSEAMLFQKKTVLTQILKFVCGSDWKILECVMFWMKVFYSVSSVVSKSLGTSRDKF